MPVALSSTPARLRGVLAPVLTPFNADLSPNFPLYLRHCQWLIQNGVGLAIFGTNSEAASVSVGERIALTDQLLAAGVPAHKLMPGTGSCSVTDAVQLTRHAVQSGAAGVLMLPPFYFKGVSDEGLFAYYADVIEKVADPRLSIYLYHIPQFTQVPISLGLIERLLKRYPTVIAGAKDSSGNWDNSKAMIDAFSREGFDVFPASESTLSRAMPIGAAGCISATVNVNPSGIQALYEALASGPSHPAEDLQAAADAIREIFQSVPMIPAMKHVVAAFSDQETWRVVRPPLTQLGEAAGEDLLARLSKVDFTMAGLRSAP